MNKCRGRSILSHLSLRPLRERSGSQALSGPGEGCYGQPNSGNRPLGGPLPAATASDLPRCARRGDRTGRQGIRQ
jgi:hypothetical protein